MKKILSNIYTLAALCMMGVATFTACSSDDAGVEQAPEQPAGKTYTMTVNASKGMETKALSISGSTLNATWTAGDAVEVWTSDGETTMYGTLTAETGGTSTTLTGELTTLPSNGQSLLLKYLSPAYATQDGTLTGSATSIDKVCDYATAMVTASVVGNNVTTDEDADFVNQQAIVKFTLKNKANDETLSVNKLFVTAGGTTCEVTPSGSAKSELYVAVPAIASGRVTLTALSGSTYYDYVKTGVTLAQSQYYAITASLTQVKNIDERPAILGRVVAANGKMYASVESAANVGTTAVAVIAQVDKNVGWEDCMAIAISDESGKMNWSAANNACNNKTPKINGATWTLPTVEYWQQMFAANGGNSNSYTGLNALITKAGGTALDTEWYYWTDTDGTNNSDYKRNMLLNDSNGTVDFNTGSDKSSQLLVRAFLWWNN